MGVTLYSLRVPSYFAGEAGSDVNTSRIFPQDVQAAITLVGGGTGDRGAKARGRCEPGLLLCSVAITALSMRELSLIPHLHGGFF